MIDDKKVVTLFENKVKELDKEIIDYFNKCKEEGYESMAVSFQMWVIEKIAQLQVAVEMLDGKHDHEP